MIESKMGGRERERGGCRKRRCWWRKNRIMDINGMGIISIPCTSLASASRSRSLSFIRI